MLPYISVFGHVIPMYSVMIIVGALISILYIKICENRREFPPADTELVLVYSIIGIFIGAKLLSLLTVLPEFIADFPFVFTDTNVFFAKYLYGGFVFYGGLLGALFAAWLYCRINKLSFFSLAKSLMPIIPLFHAFGRIGCFCMGCCYGCPTDTLGIAFTVSEIAPNGIPLLPVQLIEAAVEFVLFIILAWMAEHNRSGKSMFCTWITAYGSLRFVLEFFRADDYRGFWGVFSVSQVISILIICFAVFLLFSPAYRVSSTKQADAKNEVSNP